MYKEVDKISKINKKHKIILVSIIISIVILIIYYLYNKQNNEYIVNNFNIVENSISENIIAEDLEKEIEVEKEEIIIVHVSGAVVSEGIVELSEGSRISDAIEIAGGLLENANLTQINLAFKVEDGMKIHIPTNEEIVEDDSNKYVIEENINSDNNSKQNVKININEASIQELDTLPGIGISTAEKIIKYIEENGKFKNIEDIKNVSGIGDSKYEQIKDLISI